MSASHHALERADEGTLERLAAELLPIASALAGRDGDPAQLVADTLSRVYEHYEQLRDKSRLFPWARQILVRRFVDGHRTTLRSQRVSVAIDEAHALVAPVHSQPEDDLDLRAAVQRLPRDQRALLVLHYWAGYTLGEIAVTLGVPEGTAKSRLHATLQRLRKDMGVAHGS